MFQSVPRWLPLIISCYLCTSAIPLNALIAEEPIHRLRLKYTYATEDRLSEQAIADLLSEFNWKWDAYQLTAISRMGADAYDRLEPGRPDRSERSSINELMLESDQAFLELREFYLSRYFEQASVVIGKQQIIWGIADKLRVLDRLNPQDLREFILPDFVDSRMPLWALNLEVILPEDAVQKLGLANGLLQFVWIPDLTYEHLPGQDARFAISSPLLVPSVPIAGDPPRIMATDRPNNMVKDADYGFAFSSMAQGWDLGFYYLYHYDDIPVLFREINFSGIQPVVTIKPQYRRSHLLGNSLSKAINDWVIRSEFAVLLNKYFVTTALQDSDGVIQTTEASWVLGLDWQGWEDSWLSLQCFQSYIPEYNDKFERKQLETTLTGIVRHEFANVQWLAELIWLHNLNRHDGLISPELNYEWNESTWISGGFDLFYGDSKGLFGQFDSNDRIRIQVEVYF
jgi:hypothetical protein